MVSAGRLKTLHPGELREELGLSREKMGQIMSVSAKTVENWERLNRLPADDERRSRLAALAEMAELGRCVYGQAGFRLFLTTPLRSFGNRTPLQEIMAGHVEQVISALAADYEGLGF
jgi:transcriptional regulator with XRE-family HTH domain